MLQEPVALQVCTPLPAHCDVPGAQVPVQTPETHAESLHATEGPHCPVASQVCTALPEHRVAPGLQTPVQTPAAHVYIQVDELAQAPVASHS
jgi:hypothetical protein